MQLKFFNKLVIDNSDRKGFDFFFLKRKSVYHLHIIFAEQLCISFT